MRLFNRVAIVGLGLIGGSLALAIKKNRLSREVIGVSRHKKTLSFAKQRQAIDRGSLHLDIIKDADLVILATPVSTILALAARVSKIIPPDCIVTDVGSTKQEIVSKLAKIFAHYVGSHPLAGSEKSGFLNADADIFKDSSCILTPFKNTDLHAQEKIKQLWSKLGVKVFFLSAPTHDKILSFVSHLPHLIAFSLIGIIPKRYLRFASAGLLDTTRIAGSDDNLWSDIFLSNQKNMLKVIDLFKENLSKIESVIRRKDNKLLNLVLREAKNKREALG